MVQFHQSNYASCLKTLDALRDTFMVDVYLANHVSSLYELIRNKALIQVSSRDSIKNIVSLEVFTSVSTCASVALKAFGFLH